VPDTAEPLPPYPPARHAMRLLAAESETTVDGDVRGWLPVTPAIAAPSGGARLAAVGLLVDSLGGLRSLSAAAPDWAFTADLSVHLLPTGPVSVLRGDVHVRRRGRRTLVVDVDLTADDAIPAGLATLSFTVVARPQHLVDLQFETGAGRRPMSNLEPGQPPTDDYLAEIGVVELGPGVAVVELRPEVANTVGALHGGVHTAMMDEASTSLGRHLLGPGAETTDVHLAFLELGRSGPLRAEASAVGPRSPEGDRLTAEVRLVDAQGRLCSYATTEVMVA